MKKLAFFKLFSLLIILFSSFFWNNFSPKRKIAYKIVNGIEKKLKKKYGLYCVGIAEEAPDGKYKEIGMDFHYYIKKLSKDEGRVLLLDCKKDVLEAFNSYPQFRQYMEDVPFTGKNITINIYIHPRERYDVYYPDYDGCSFIRDTLRYFTNIPNNPNSYEFYTIEKESLEEAQKIVNAQARGVLPFKRA